MQHVRRGPKHLQKEYISPPFHFFYTQWDRILLQKQKWELRTHTGQKVKLGRLHVFYALSHPIPSQKGRARVRYTHKNQKIKYRKKKQK